MGAWPVVGGVAVLGLVVAAATEAGPRGYWAPAGFVAQADSLIAAGHLELLCGAQDSVVVRFEPGSPEERFFERSYLRADVRAFNANPVAARSPFVTEGCALLGVDPFYHRVDLPYNRLPRWSGAVRYTFDGHTATLEGGEGQALEVRHPEPGEPASVLSVSPAADRYVGSASLFRLTEPGSPEVVADVFFTGIDPVLADRRDVGRPLDVRVNGHRTPPGRLVRLAVGDWVQLEAGGRHTYLVEGPDRARTASFLRIGVEGRERRYPARRLRPLLEPFAQAMDLALQSIPEGGESRVGRMDVQLTLDRSLHEGVEDVVLQSCREAAHPTRPRAASLIVMDAFSGWVRAMPSCPGEEEMTRYEPLPRRTRDRFLRNQNLAAHPIGSAGKPFWTAAVATAFPAFLDLEVAAHDAGAQPSVLGCELPAAYADFHGSAEWVGLEEFLRRSCNRYLIDFATAALALGSTGGQRCATADPVELERCFREAGALAPADAGRDEAAPVRFCDQVVNLVLSPALDVVGPSCNSLQLVDARFAPRRRLSGLANVRTYRDPTPVAGEGGTTLAERYRFGRYRLDAWSPVLDALAVAADTVDVVRTSLRFSGVSPQATNLALNTVEELRRDWVNLLLGGENSRWSNFELAEATARLMTGRRVSGELVRTPDDSDEPSWFDPEVEIAAADPLLSSDVLDDRVRRRVVHAMERVAGPGGTAARLAPAIRDLAARLENLDGTRPYDLYVSAKTGTPAVETHAGGGAPEQRRGSVLVLGILAVPADRGREAWRDSPAEVSTCSLDPTLERGILGVPPAVTLDPGQDVALSVAVYLDDLEPDEVASATGLMTRAFDPIADYVVEEVARRLSR